MSLISRFKAVAQALLPQHSAPAQPTPPPPEIRLVQPGQLLQGKNIFITGAARNIGRAIALECAQQGANLYWIDVDQNQCQQLETTLLEMGCTAKGFVGDMTQLEQIDAIWQLLLEQQIEVDVLVNNVGIHLPTSIYQFKLQEWQNTYETNILGPVYLTHLVSQAMSQRSSSNIIFLSSIHQWLPVGCAGYSASKTTIGMIIEELAIELAPYGIRVNGIAPGWTALNDDGLPHPDRRGHLHQTSIPPQYIGRAAVYLAADYFSQYTTGTVLKVDSGLSLMHRAVPKPTLIYKAERT